MTLTKSLLQLLRDIKERSNRRCLFSEKSSGVNRFRPELCFEKDIVWDQAAAPDKSIHNPCGYSVKV